MLKFVVELDDESDQRLRKKGRQRKTAIHACNDKTQNDYRASSPRHSKCGVKFVALSQSSSGRVVPVPVPFPDHDEGAPSPSHLGTGETAHLNWQEEARGLAGSVLTNADLARRDWQRITGESPSNSLTRNSYQCEDHSSGQRSRVDRLPKVE